MEAGHAAHAVFTFVVAVVAALAVSWLTGAILRLSARGKSPTS